MCEQRFLRYLQGSKGLKFTYTKETSYDLVGESDDLVGSSDVNDGKSTTGYYFKLNGRSAALSWGVKKQATVALSSSEAEYLGHGSSSSRSILSETTSGGFRHPTETPSSNWRTTRVVLNCAKTQSCTRGANTLRQNFTSFAAS